MALRDAESPGGPREALRADRAASVVPIRPNLEDNFYLAMRQLSI